MPRNSRLEYNDYLLLTVGLDAEWSRPGTADSTLKAFVKTGEKFKESARDNLYAAKIAEERRAGASGTRLGALYEAVYYFPLGHADVLGFVLIDDFAMVHDITAKITTTIEEIILAACPKIGSILLPDVSSPWTSHLIDPHELVGKLKDEQSVRTPAVAFTRMKLTGLATLGLGLALQYAVFQAVAREIIAVLGHLADSVDSAFEISREAMENTWISLLDLYGPEEVGILIATPNLSISASLTARLGCLTFDDLVRVNGQLLEGVGRTKYFQQLSNSYNAIAAARNRQDANDPLPECLGAGCLGGSHITRWARTTVGIHGDYFPVLVNRAAIGKFTELSGWVNAVSEIRIASGHRVRVDEALQEWFASDGEKFPRVAFDSNVPFRLRGLGRADLLLEHSVILKHSGGSAAFPHTPAETLVPMRTFIGVVFGIMEALTDHSGGMSTGKGGRSSRKQLRDLVGTSSFTSIPAPVLLDEAKVDRLSPDFDPARHLCIIQVILPRLREHLQEKWLGTEELAKIRQYGLPESLVSSVQFLYQDYINICTNSMTFDTVLDLYDSFAALHKALASLLPEVIDESLKAANERPDEWNLRSCQIDSGRVNQIARYLNALHRTMQHRLHQAFPEDVHRDMEVDYRGGLHCIQYAADSVLKCGVGVFRRHILGNVEALQPAPAEIASGGAESERAKARGAKPKHDRVGVLTQTDFEPGIVNTMLHLGVENRSEGVRLASVRMDVPHTLHAPSYVDMLHEAFHLIYDHLRGSPHKEAANLPPPPMPKGRRAFLPTVPHGSPYDEHIDEIFVNLLTVSVVCLDKPHLFKEHFMIQFAGAMEWGLPDRGKFRTTVINKLIRIFYIIAGAKYLREMAETGKTDAEDFLKGSYIGDFTECVDMALLYLPLGKLFSDADTVRNDIRRLAIESLEEAQATFHPLLRIAVGKVAEIVESIRKSIWEKHTGNENHGLKGKALLKEIETLEAGIRQLMMDSDSTGGKRVRSSPIAAGEMITGAFSGRKYDSLLIVAQILRQLMDYKEAHFNKLGQTAEWPYIDFKTEMLGRGALGPGAAETNPSGFWISMTSPALLCISTTTRASCLLLQITSIKALWDVASHLRAKRLREMLGEVHSL